MKVQDKIKLVQINLVSNSNLMIFLQKKQRKINRIKFDHSLLLLLIIGKMQILQR